MGEAGNDVISRLRTLVSPEGIKQAGRRARAVTAACALLALLAMGQTGYSFDQNVGPAQQTLLEPGNKHLITASMKADPANGMNSYQADDHATLTAMVRISDHARESQFFGDIAVTMSDFLLASGSAEQKIWSDSTCHQRRGIPKFAVIAIDGFVMGAQGRMSVTARQRHIGLLLPPDEISVARRLLDDVDNIGPFTVLRAGTNRSHLVMDLKLYTLNCDIIDEK
jgi:hypothetical protein